MRVIVLVFAVWIGIPVVPVDAAVRILTGVNRDTITIGDPFVLRMRISRSADDQVEIAFGKDFPGSFEVRHTGDLKSVEVDDGQVQDTQDLVLTIYQVGAFEIPPVSVHFVGANGDSGKIASQPIGMLVQSVKPEGTSDIRDVKPPVVIGAQMPMWFLFVAGGAALALVGLIWYLYWRRNRPEADLPPPPMDWLVELDKVRRLGLLEQENYRQYYSLLSDVLRRCLEAKTPVHAVERTTYEIGRDLRNQMVDDQLVMNVERFLNEADMVKFAKFAPHVSVANEAIDQVREVVRILIKVTEE